MAEAAAQEFDRVFRDRQDPAEIETFEIASASGIFLLPQVLTASGLTSSNSEARRLIQQGAVEVDDERVLDVNQALKPEPDRKYKVRVGKRRFKKIGYK